MFKKNNPKLCRDMHNMILYPGLLNSCRSNYRYVNEFVLDDTSIILDGAGNPYDYEGPIIDKRIGLISNKHRTYYPRPFYRGGISRACMYMANRYPEYREKIFNTMIDPYVLLTWHHEKPVSNFEKRKNERIYDLQGNYNPYVEEPDRVLEDMEKYLGKSLNIYKNYKYSSLN